MKTYNLILPFKVHNKQFRPEITLNNPENSNFLYGMDDKNIVVGKLNEDEISLRMFSANNIFGEASFSYKKNKNNTYLGTHYIFPFIDAESQFNYKQLAEILTEHKHVMGPYILSNNIDNSKIESDITDILIHFKNLIPPVKPKYGFGELELKRNN